MIISMNDKECQVLCQGKASWCYFLHNTPDLIKRESRRRIVWEGGRRRTRILFWEIIWRKGEKSLCWEEREPESLKNVEGSQKQNLGDSVKRMGRVLECTKGMVMRSSRVSWEICAPWIILNQAVRILSEYVTPFSPGTVFTFEHLNVL